MRESGPCVDDLLHSDVLHLAAGVALSVNVGDLLELEGSFKGDGVVDAAAEEVLGGVDREKIGA